jgi:uncharacterized protein
VTAGSRVRLALFAFLVSVAAARAQTGPPPSPDDYATDLAGVVDAARLAALDAKLAAYDKKTTNQIVVYVDRRLPAGAVLEEFSMTAFDAWKVGQKGQDNGVVFFVFVEDRRMRLELGGGAMTAISDALAAEIIDTEAKPRFRANDYAGGIEGVVDRVIRALDAAGVPSGKKRSR